MRYIFEPGTYSTSYGCIIPCFYDTSLFSEPHIPSFPNNYKSHGIFSLQFDAGRVTGAYDRREDVINLKEGEDMLVFRDGVG